MPLTLLVVDDNASIRQLVQRVIARYFDARVLEAHDGVGALDLLLTEEVDVMLLDVSMPIMGGIETLEAVRRSARHAGLPVMILAGKAEEQQVLRLVQLGIAGFLVKPFKPTVLRDRLSTLLAQIPSHSSQQRGRLQSRLELQRSSRVLVVDRSPEFCEFFAQQLRMLCEVEIADEFPRALTICVEAPPDAVFVGTVDQGLEAELFVRKVRLASKHREVSVMAIVVGSDEAEAFAAQGLYDGILRRSYVPETFRLSLRNALTDATAARWLLSPRSARVMEFGSRAHEFLKTNLRLEVVVADAKPEWARQSGRWIVAALELHTHGLSWDLTLQLPYTAALALGAAQLDLTTDEISTEALFEATRAVVSAIGVALQASMQVEDLRLECGKPRVSMAAEYMAPASHQRADEDAHWWFSRTGMSDGIVLTLAPLGLGGDGVRSNWRQKALNG